MQFHTLYNTPQFSFEGQTVPARVVDVYDGDTITAVIEVFPGKFHQFKVRLVNIDTPEMRGGTVESKKKATLARNTLLSIITRYGVNCTNISPSDIKQILNGPIAYIVYIRCFGNDKYGRMLGEIFMDSDLNHPSCNQMLLSWGLAKPYFGGTREILLGVEDDNDAPPKRPWYVTLLSCCR